MVCVVPLRQAIKTLEGQISRSERTNCPGPRRDENRLISWAARNEALASPICTSGTHAYASNGFQLEMTGTIRAAVIKCYLLQGADNTGDLRCKAGALCKSGCRSDGTLKETQKVSQLYEDREWIGRHAWASLELSRLDLSLEITLIKGREAHADGER